MKRPLGSPGVRPCGTLTRALLVLLANNEALCGTYFDAIGYFFFKFSLDH